MHPKVFTPAETPMQAILEGVLELPFFLSLAGAMMAWVCYIFKPELPMLFKNRFSIGYAILMNKFGFDSFNEWFWVKGAKNLGQFFFHYIDQKVIDGAAVNGSAQMVSKLSQVTRRLQSGYLFNYLAVMVLGLLGILFWFMLV